MGVCGSCWICVFLVFFLLLHGFAFFVVWSHCPTISEEPGPSLVCFAVGWLEFCVEDKKYSNSEMQVSSLG